MRLRRSPTLLPGCLPPPPLQQDPRNIYLAIDEACTHVGAAAFRLLAGMYDISGERLLATAVSPPIRVLANNDVPTGAARIPIDVREENRGEAGLVVRGRAGLGAANSVDAAACPAGIAPPGQLCEKCTRHLPCRLCRSLLNRSSCQPTGKGGTQLQSRKRRQRRRPSSARAGRAPGRLLLG